MARLLAMAVASVMVVAACGGNDETGTTGSTDTSASQPTSTQAAEAPDDSTTSTSDAGEDGGSPEGSGPSTATVMLGDETYEFSTEGALVAQCQTDLYGIFSVQLPRVDGDGSIQLVILHDDTDPSVVEQVNAVSVSIGDEDWFADEASDMFANSDTLQKGMSQVDSAEIDGSTVSGTATFVRQLSLFTGEMETVTGTFEATCGEERLS